MSGYYSPQTRNSLKIKSNGITLSDDATELDFTGAGQTGLVVGSVVTENIPGGGSGATYAYNEILSGTGTIFTLAHAPSPSGSLILIKNGQVFTPGIGQDYTISGANITLVISVTNNDLLVAQQYTY